MITMYIILFIISIIGITYEYKVDGEVVKLNRPILDVIILFSSIAFIISTVILILTHCP